MILPKSILRLAEGASIDTSQDQLITIRSPWMECRFNDPPQFLHSMLLLLSEKKYTLDQIVDKLIQNADSSSLYADIFFAIDRLKCISFIDEIIGNGSISIIIETGYKEYFKDWLSSLNTDIFCLSRFALLRKENGSFLWETPLSPYRIRSASPTVLQFITEFITPKTLDQALKNVEIDKELAVQIFAAFKEAKIILSEEQESTAILKQWEFHDLLFHTRTRLGRSREPAGPLFPFVGEIPPLPPIKTVESSLKIPMSHSPIRDHTKSLDQIIDSRRSRYPSSKTIISSKILESFFDRCLSVTQEMFYLQKDVRVDISKRPYPSAGGLYELEIYPLIHKCEGLERGLYHYNPKEHALVPMPVIDAYLNETVRLASLSAKGPEPQVLLMITARFSRLAWKYRSYAYALMLKDVGVLTAYMYIFAEYFDLAGCALGAGNADLFAKMTDINYFDEPYVGDFMLGAKDNKDMLRAP